MRIGHGGARSAAWSPRRHSTEHAVCANETDLETVFGIFGAYSSLGA